MSKITIETTLTRKYLMNKTKDELASWILQDADIIDRLKGELDCCSGDCEAADMENEKMTAILDRYPFVPQDHLETLLRFAWDHGHDCPLITGAIGECRRGMNYFVQNKGLPKQDIFAGRPRNPCNPERSRVE